MIALGAPVDLCAAAALGDLARVQAAFDERGQLRERIWRRGGDLPPREAVGLALLFAYVNRQPHVVDALFERDGDWNATGVLNGTALHRAAWTGDLAMVQRLIARGADPSNRDNPFTATAFGWAVHNRQAAVADWLRAKGLVDLHDAVAHDLTADAEARLRDDPAAANRRRDHWNIPDRDAAALGRGAQSAAPGARAPRLRRRSQHGRWTRTDAARLRRRAGRDRGDRDPRPARRPAIRTGVTAGGYEPQAAWLRTYQTAMTLSGTPSSQAAM